MGSPPLPLAGGAGGGEGERPTTPRSDTGQPHPSIPSRKREGGLEGPRDGEFDGFGQRGPGVARRERAQSVDGVLRVGAGARECVVERAAVAKQQRGVGEVLVAVAAAL